MQMSKKTMNLFNRYSWFLVDSNKEVIIGEDIHHEAEGLVKAFKTKESSICKVFILDSYLEVIFNDKIDDRVILDDFKEVIEGNALESLSKRLSIAYLEEILFIIKAIWVSKNSKIKQISS